PVINGGAGPSGSNTDSGAKQPAFTDAFSRAALDAGWQWPVRRNPRWQLGHGTLTLEPSSDGAAVFIARSLLAPFYASDVGVRNMGGLGIIGGSHSMLVLSRRADHLELWRLSNAGRQVLWQSKIVPTSIVWLRATSAGLSRTSFSYSLDHKQWIAAGSVLSVTDLLP